MNLQSKVQLFNFISVLASVANYYTFYNSASYRDEGILVIFLLGIAYFYFFVLKPLIRSISRASDVMDSLAKEGIKSPAQPNENNEIEKIASLTHYLSKNIQKATQFIGDIKSGNLHADVSTYNQDADENCLTHSLLGLRNQMILLAAEEEERRWVTEGLAQFVEILRTTHQDTTTFYDQIISTVVKYLNANQGGLFIVNERNGEKHMSLISSYAYSRKKFLQKEIAIGEGLIGQAFLEKDTLFMSEIPEDYLSISSGLGTASPRFLLIVPFILNDSVECIIELASFHEFKQYQIEFIEKLGESIASSVFNMRINENTKLLLDESQQQANIMQAQEEEMRQSMEELAATQEEMRRKEVEMLKMVEKLSWSENVLKEKLQEIHSLQAEEQEKTKGHIATMDEHRKMLIDIINKIPQKIFLKDKDGKILIANNALASDYNKSVEELIGTSDFDFFSFEVATEYRNKELEIIASGQPEHFEETFHNPNGENKTLETIKMPFHIGYLNQTGLLGIQTDITNIKMMEKAILSQKLKK